jgi:RND family efflux transporter MFP subunit
MKRLTNRITYPIVALAVMVIALGGCGKKEEEAGAAVVRPIETVILGGGESGRYYFPGTVQAANRAEIAFRVPGQIIELPVNEGDNLRKGQLIARLDPRDYDVALREARAAYDKAAADAERYKRLYERDAIPLADLELRQAQRDVAEAHYDQASLNLGYATLGAPYDGWVGRKYVENFEDVQAKQAVVSLQSLDRLEIYVDVPEYLMATARDHRGTDFVVRFGASGDTEFPITVKEFSAQADIRTQTFQITFSMKPPEGITVLPGMTGQVIMIDKEDDDQTEVTDFAVPSFAVVADADGEPYVWIVDPEAMTVSKRQVKLGRVAGKDQIWITEGVSEGERIAAAGVHHLQEGMQVRLMEN